MPPITDPDGAMFEKLRPRLTAISRRIVGSEAEAEDVVQDCFFKWQGIDQTALETAAAWLTTVVRHQSIDRLRKRARDLGVARGSTELAPEAPPAQPENELLRRAEVGEALARLLARLSPSERLALVLHEVFECGHADIAAALGTTPVNARQYLARARRRLRDDDAKAASGEKLCRELIRHFQAALNGRDVPAMMTLLGDDQPVSVIAAPSPRLRGASANDARYRPALAA
ncbi:MAG TPA: sigma-70 family RNA polymerase sigma factor [Duganella sp.]|jgi:RNA polymerase sigma-70 factor (ECF subfamily)